MVRRGVIGTHSVGRRPAPTEEVPPWQTRRSPTIARRRTGRRTSPRPPVTKQEEWQERPAARRVPSCPRPGTRAARWPTRPARALRQQASAGTDRAAGTLDQIAGRLRALADGDSEQAGDLQRYARDLGDRLGGVAGRLQERAQRGRRRCVGLRPPPPWHVPGGRSRRGLRCGVASSEAPRRTPTRPVPRGTGHVSGSGAGRAAGGPPSAGLGRGPPRPSDTGAESAGPEDGTIPTPTSTPTPYGGPTSGGSTGRGGRGEHLRRRRPRPPIGFGGREGTAAAEPRSASCSAG